MLGSSHTVLAKSAITRSCARLTVGCRGRTLLRSPDSLAGSRHPEIYRDECRELPEKLPFQLYIIPCATFHSMLLKSKNLVGTQSCEIG